MPSPDCGAEGYFPTGSTPIPTTKKNKNYAHSQGRLGLAAQLLEFTDVAGGAGWDGRRMNYVVT